VLLEDLTWRGHSTAVTSVEDAVLLLIWLTADGEIAN